MNEYRRCDVPKALSDHLRIREGGEQNRITDSGIVLVPNKKRRTRGCRGGKAEQKKKRERLFYRKNYQQ